MNQLFALLAAGELGRVSSGLAAARAQGAQGPAWDLLEGLFLRAVGQGAGAVGRLQAALGHPSTRNASLQALGEIASARGDHREAARFRRQLAEALGNSAEAWRELGFSLLYDNDAVGAAQATERAVALAPRDLGLRWFDARVLPVVYRDRAEMAAFRNRYRARLGVLERLLPAAPVEAKTLLEQSWDAFHLHYQGEPLVEEQALLGRILGRLGERALALDVPQGSGVKGRIRVAFASSLWTDHTIAWLFRGWVEQLDRSVFEVVLVFFGEQGDEVTEALAAGVDRFVHLPRAPLQESAETLLGLQLDALVWPDLGMDRRLLRLAALRLAPLQLVSWGHPVTTGLPNIDGFLSCELMEGPEASSHYTEALLRLPGLGIYLDPAPLPPQRLQRADFGLSADDLVLLVPQSPFKLLPQFDRIYAEIARQRPESRLVLIGGAINQASRGVKDTLIARLHKAFSEQGLDLSRHLHFLPVLSHGDFLDLNRCADLFLDTPGWSGGRTTLEALSAGLVPITLPGALMRQRHTAAILAALGVPELIVADAQAYVRLVVALSGDPVARAQLKERLTTALPRLYRDRRGLLGLEQILRAGPRAIRATPAGTGDLPSGL